mmetsp:Transcript_36349/g.83305  ORF Transcript_36349/g.83305 Transcript_36349/m.83305 type:complete len:263 (+) Transcript_36349:286-1074(+)
MPPDASVGAHDRHCRWQHGRLSRRRRPRRRRRRRRRSRRSAWCGRRRNRRPWPWLRRQLRGDHLFVLIIHYRPQLRTLLALVDERWVDPLHPQPVAHVEAVPQHVERRRADGELLQECADLDRATLPSRRREDISLHECSARRDLRHGEPAAPHGEVIIVQLLSQRLEVRTRRLEEGWFERRLEEELDSYCRRIDGRRTHRRLDDSRACGLDGVLQNGERSGPHHELRDVGDWEEREREELASVEGAQLKGAARVALDHRDL